MQPREILRDRERARALELPSDQTKSGSTAAWVRESDQLDSATYEPEIQSVLIESRASPAWAGGLLCGGRICGDELARRHRDEGRARSYRWRLGVIPRLWIFFTVDDEDYVTLRAVRPATRPEVLEADV